MYVPSYIMLEGVGIVVEVVVVAVVKEEESENTCNNIKVVPRRPKNVKANRLTFYKKYTIMINTTKKYI